MINEMTFGIEIESHLPSESPIQVGCHGAGNSIDSHGLPGWKADGDPSIRAPHGRKACEFVSPIYKGSDGLAQFIRDLATIRNMGAKVNRSCGLHIHVGFDHADMDTKARLITLVANFEKAIYASTGTKKRERSRWCNGINRHGTVNQVISNGCRYHVLNINTHKPTVEFRAFAGSTNARKIIGYIRLCVGLVERAIRMKRLTNWTAKVPAETSPVHRGGEGQTALNRLFYQMGWHKGCQAHVHGDLQTPGAPSIRTTKKAMMKLAKKYDESI